MSKRFTTAYGCIYEAPNMTDKPPPLIPKAAKEYLEFIKSHLSDNQGVNIIEAFMAGQDDKERLEDIRLQLLEDRDEDGRQIKHLNGMIAKIKALCEYWGGIDHRESDVTFWQLADKILEILANG